MTRSLRGRREPVPWWLEPGDEQCGFCLATYRCELERRCVECDRAVCPFCVVTLRRRADVRCPDCGDARSPC